MRTLFIIGLVMALSGCSVLQRHTPEESIPQVGKEALSRFSWTISEQGVLCFWGAVLFGISAINGSRSGIAGVMACIGGMVLATVWAQHAGLISWICIIGAGVWAARSLLLKRGIFTIRR